MMLEQILPRTNSNLESWLADERVRIVAALVTVAVFAFLPFDIPLGVEWYRTFRQAALDILNGANPYTNDHFFNAPWTAAPLIPLAVLPARMGRNLFFLMGLVSFLYAAIRFKARPLALAAFLLSPPVIGTILGGNVDWMPVLGFAFSPPLGLVLMMVKPQTSLGVALLVLIEAWRKGGPARCARLLAPVTGLTLFSFLVFGLWPLRFTTVFQVGVNTSLFPFTIPIGLALLTAAVRKRDLRYAMGVGPCLSPYVELHSWVGGLLALVEHDAEIWAAVVGFWILTLWQAR